MTLLDEVRSAVIGHSADDYVPDLRRGQGLQLTEVLDAARLGDDAAVAALGLVDGRRLLVPLVRDGNWRRAAPTDGMSMVALSAPSPIQVRFSHPCPTVDPTRERDLAVDMSNDVRVIDDAIVAKWQTFGEAGSLAGPRVVEHLAAAGFSDMPEPIATVSWNDELLVSYARFLPGAQDGWDWMLGDVATYIAGEAPRPDWASTVGVLTAHMHAAASRSTHVITKPVAVVDLAPLAAHYGRLRDASGSLDPELSEVVLAHRDRFDRAWATLSAARDVEAIPIHGDLHAGQFLRWAGEPDRGGLADPPGGIVINDFDGNPLLPPDQRGAPGPSALDVASLLRSLDHVAIAAARRIDTPGALDSARAWAREARDEALRGYRSVPDAPALDDNLLEAFESLSPLHEAVYAATYLPRWRYVPLAVLAGGW